MLRRLLVVFGLLGAGFVVAPPASAGGGCHGGGAREAAGTTVALSMNCMTPRVLHVAEGAEVTFVNKDQVEHNLFGDGWFEDGFGEGESRTHRFSTGTHVYACTIHPGMVGAVVAGSTAAVPIAATTPAPPETGSRWWPVALGGALAGAVLAGVGTRFRRVRR